MIIDLLTVIARIIIVMDRGSTRHAVARISSMQGD